MTAPHGFKAIAAKMANFFACLVVFAAMALPIHEGGHALAAQLFGMTGSIRLDWAELGGNFFYDGWILDWQLAVVAFAGGGFVALMYGLLLVCANIGKHWDMDDQLAIRLVLGLQLGYAISEIFLVTADRATFEMARSIGMATGVAVVIAYSFRGIRDWYLYHK